MSNRVTTPEDLKLIRLLKRAINYRPNSDDDNTDPALYWTTPRFLLDSDRLWIESCNGDDLILHPSPDGTMDRDRVAFRIDLQHEKILGRNAIWEGPVRRELNRMFPLDALADV